MFSNKNLDRWGQPVAPRRPFNAALDTPGPGWYEADPAAAAPPAAHWGGRRRSSAKADPSFASTTPRAPSYSPTKLVPGPAYYKPHRPESKSFLLNSSKKWI